MPRSDETPPAARPDGRFSPPPTMGEVSALIRQVYDELNRLRERCGLPMIVNPVVMADDQRVADHTKLRMLLSLIPDSREEGWLTEGARSCLVDLIREEAKEVVRQAVITGQLPVGKFRATLDLTHREMEVSRDFRLRPALGWPVDPKAPASPDLPEVAPGDRTLVIACHQYRRFMWKPVTDLPTGRRVVLGGETFDVDGIFRTAGVEVARLRPLTSDWRPDHRWQEVRLYPCPVFAALEL